MTRRRIVDDMSRKDQVVLNRVTLGHTRLTHSYHIHKEPIPMCTHCNVKLDVDHLLFQCPLYEPNRLQYKIDRMSLKGIEECSRSVFKFLKDLGLYADI